MGRVVLNNGARRVEPVDSQSDLVSSGGVLMGVFVSIFGTLVCGYGGYVFGEISLDELHSMQKGKFIFLLAVFITWVLWSMALLYLLSTLYLISELL